MHAKFFRERTDPEEKYVHMKAMHDYLWPELVPTWNYWEERRFKAHCRGYRFVSYAGGASTAKSFTAAKIALLFWFANPQQRGVVVASTTMDALGARVWGYTCSLLAKAKRTMPGVVGKRKKGNNPKIMHPDADDDLHGIFAIAAKKGDSKDAISSWIGRHPEDGFLVILDEATDLPPAILDAVVNLKAGGKFFQMMAIGNPSSRFDVHGALSTPKRGWESVNPEEDLEWETSQKNGICLFFSCYDSPAIYETDPVKRELLGLFLPTAERIKEDEEEFGKDSIHFMRMVLGFWSQEGQGENVMTSKFISQFSVKQRAQWAGIYPLRYVAGLDPSFTQGGDKCLLRIGTLGHTVNGSIVLDLCGTDQLFSIPLLARSLDPIENQIATRVLAILTEYSIPLSALAIDISGQGRAIGEVIRLVAKTAEHPIKIQSIGLGNGMSGKMAKRTLDVTIKTTSEMWLTVRNYIQHNQLFGLDADAIYQFTSRQMTQNTQGRYIVEPKADYKSRMGAVSPTLARSPDEADTVALVLQAAIMKYGFSIGEKKEIEVVKEDVYAEKIKAYKIDAMKQQLSSQAKPRVFSSGYTTGLEARPLAAQIRRR